MYFRSSIFQVHEEAAEVLSLQGDVTSREDVVVQTDLEAAEILRLHHDIRDRNDAMAELQTELLHRKQEISALRDERDELKLEVSSSYDMSSDEYVSWLRNMTIVVW